MSIWDLAMHIHCETCEERLHPIADESWSNRIVRIVVNRKPGPRWTSKEQMGANECSEHFLFFHILGIVIPTDYFSEGLKPPTSECSSPAVVIVGTTTQASRDAPSKCWTFACWTRLGPAAADKLAPIHHRYRIATLGTESSTEIKSPVDLKPGKPANGVSSGCRPTWEKTVRMGIFVAWFCLQLHPDFVLVDSPFLNFRSTMFVCQLPIFDA